MEVYRNLIVIHWMYDRMYDRMLCTFCQSIIWWFTAARVIQAENSITLTVYNSMNAD